MPAVREEPVGWTVRLRLPAIERNDALLRRVQTPIGKCLLFFIFAGLMRVHAKGMWIESHWTWLVLTLAAAGVSLAGRWRHAALLLCAILLLYRSPNWFDFSAVFAAARIEGLASSLNRNQLRAAILCLAAACAISALWLARRYRDHPVGRRPILLQHAIYGALLALAATHFLSGMAQVALWGLIAVFSAYFSFFAYALIDQRHRTPSPWALQLASFNPFCWPTPVPMGKGAANWRSVEARTAEELAITQLKGLKLLIWALLLKGLLWAYRTLLYGTLGVMPLEPAFEHFLRNGTVPPNALFSVLINFPEQLLSAAIWGHVFVATARLAGFRLLRNTWRPLSARTIAEFWNRYIYYFKEVLATIYFYPIYLRYFKRHPRIRLAFATFMAAGAGNFFLHFIVERRTIVEHGLLEALARMQTYAFYCFVLATGIVVSQLRSERSTSHPTWLRGQLIPSLGVASFFCFLSFFDGPQRHVGLIQHFEFLLQTLSIRS